MFGLDWTFKPQRISKKVNVKKINVRENKVTKTRKALERKYVNCEEVKNYINPTIGCFNKAIAPVIFTSQIFGLFPVQGIFSSNVNDLKFSWKSLRTLYNIVIALIFCLRLISKAKSYVKTSSTKYIIDFIILAPLSLVLSIKSILLARRWPSLMKKWYDVEVLMAKYQFKNASKAMIRNGRIAAVFLVLDVLALLALTIIQNIRDVIACYDVPERLNAFIRISTEQMFFKNDTSFLTLAVGLVGGLEQLVVLNFINYIIIVLCLGLISNFRIINENLLATKDRNMPLSYWTTVRADYQRLVDLCKAVDDEICFSMMLKLFTEIYFLTSRFVKNIKYYNFRMHDFISLWLFLIFTFMQCFGKMFLGSKINDESKRPLKVLRAVLNKSWIFEVHRFADEVITNTVGLSVMKFFFITRRGILSVFGTLVTYTVILFQFKIQSTFTQCEKKN